MGRLSLSISLNLGGIGVGILLWVLSKLEVHVPKILLYALLVVAVALIVVPWLIMGAQQISKRRRRLDNDLEQSEPESGETPIFPPGRLDDHSPQAARIRTSLARRSVAAQDIDDSSDVDSSRLYAAIFGEEQKELQERAQQIATENVDREEGRR
jgi:hypothetical protein